MIGSDQGEALSSSRSLHSNIDDLVLDEVDFDDMFSWPRLWYGSCDGRGRGL